MMTKDGRDRTKKPLYVHRPVIDGDGLLDWARAAGIETPLDRTELHVTIIYSKAPVEFELVDPDPGEVIVELHDARAFRIRSSLALPLDHSAIRESHARLLALGATHDYSDAFHPHVSLAYHPTDEEVRRAEGAHGFTGRVMLGPERLEPLKQG